MQMEIPRYGPMIRSSGPSNAGLRRSQTLRKEVVKAGVRKAVIPWVSYSFRQS